MQRLCCTLTPTCTDSEHATALGNPCSMACPWQCVADYVKRPECCREGSSAPGLDSRKGKAQASRLPARSCITLREDTSRHKQHSFASTGTELRWLCLDNMCWQGVGYNQSAQAGYYCNVCDCILRDSQSYLDHINGKYHNRALGMSMTVEKSTADDVRKKFESLQKDRDAPVPVDSVMDGESLHKHPARTAWAASMVLL